MRDAVDVTAQWINRLVVADGLSRDGPRAASWHWIRPHSGSFHLDFEAIKSILRRYAAAFGRDDFEAEPGKQGERKDFLRSVEKLSGSTDLSGPAKEELSAFARDLFRAFVNRASAKRNTAAQGAIAAIADYDQAIALAQELRPPFGDDWPMPSQNELAGACVQRGIAKQDVPWHGTPAIGDFDLAIALREELRSRMGEAWPPEWRNDLAVSYQTRGAAKRSTPGYGVATAVSDDDQAIALMEELVARREALRPEWCNDLATAYINRGNAKQDDPRYGPAAAIADYDRAIDVMAQLRAALGARWPARWRNDLASAHLNRGNANQKAAGATAAIADFDQAIALLQEERLPPGEFRPAEWTNDLARAYQNRGSVKWHAPEHGAAAAIADYDQAIALREEARSRAGENWPAPLRFDLASTYLSRGNVTRFASAQGAAAAIADYDRAIGLMEELRAKAAEGWLIPWRKDFADAYASRGNAKQSAAGYPAVMVIDDCDQAIALMEELRATMPEDWPKPMRYALAHVYMTRGSSKQDAPGQGTAAAVADFDRAIALMEGLRTAQLDDWPALWRQGLAVGYFLRAQARRRAADRVGACADARCAENLFLELVRFAGEGPWTALAPRASALCKEVCDDRGCARWSV